MEGGKVCSSEGAVSEGGSGSGKRIFSSLLLISIPLRCFRFQPRDNIAKTWPDSIDDSAARRDWGWQHEYGLDAMVHQMLSDLARMQRQEAVAKEAAAERKLQGKAASAMGC